MKKVIILGGGFAGSYLAKKLEKKFTVTLIDQKDYFEFTPSILKVLIEPEYAKKIQKKYSDFLKDTNIVINKVKKVDEQFVYFDNKKLNFDYLFICTGSSYNLPFKDKVVLADRAENILKNNKKLMDSKRITVIGGGVVGVELIAEILDKFYDKKITLIESNDTLLCRENKKTQNYVNKFMKKNNVKIILNEKVEDVQNKFSVTDKETRIDHDLVYLSTGINPNSDIIDKKYLNERKHIIVNDFLQVDSLKNIFALGDVNSILEEKTAQAAEKQARVAIKNLFNLEKEKQLVKYNSDQKPRIISLGEKTAIFTYKNFSYKGIIPSLMRKIIELRTMNRLKGN